VVGCMARIYRVNAPQLYEDALRRLTDQGLVYPCYCSRPTWPRSAPLMELRARAIRALPRPDARATRRQGKAGRPPSLRFRVREGKVAYQDLLLGPVEQDVASEVGDFVLRRALQLPANGRGTVAYQLAWWWTTSPWRSARWCAARTSLPPRRGSCLPMRRSKRRPPRFATCRWCSARREQAQQARRVGEPGILDARA